MNRRGTAILILCAVVAATIVMAARPATASSLFEQARRAALAGRHAETVTLLRAYVVKSPRDAAAWVWLGASYYQLNQFQPAATAFDRAQRLLRSADVALWQGAAYVKLGRTDLASAAFLYASRAGRLQTAFVAARWLRTLRGEKITAVLARPARPEAYAYIVRWYNSRLTPSQVDAIVRSVLYYSYRYSVDPELMMALIAIESGFQITARSPVGAFGLGQLMPATWQSIGIHPADPVANIYASVRVLRGNLDRFGGNAMLALAAYNAGKGSVERYGGIPPYSETQWYVRNVLVLYLHFRGE